MANASARKYPAIIPMIIGLICLIVLVVGVGFWSVTSKISGAVIATGSVKVEANRQVVQHPEGGVVGTINVRDGDPVDAGEVLLSFDGTLMASELAIVEDQLFDILARKARLIAERDDLGEPVYPKEILDRALTNPELAQQVEGQTTLFLARLVSIAKQKEELQAQVDQIYSQIEGVDAQYDAANKQFALIQEELTDAQSLEKKGLIQASRVLALQRSEAEILGSLGSLLSQRANLQGSISRINIRAIQLETTRREDAITQVRDLQARELELAERRLSIKERLSRLEVRAPMAGVVYGSTVFALKSVVRPADPIMYVIPKGQPLLIQAQVSAQEIDSVYVGQETILRFSSFNQRTTPEINGTVRRLSADVLVDQNTGVSYYEADILPNEGEIEKLGEVEVVPGMPVETLMRTDDRSPMSYLMKPLTDYFNRAFRGT